MSEEDPAKILREAQELMSLEFTVTCVLMCRGHIGRSEAIARCAHAVDRAYNRLEPLGMVRREEGDDE